MYSFVLCRDLRPENFLWSILINASKTVASESRGEKKKHREWTTSLRSERYWQWHYPCPQIRQLQIEDCSVSRWPLHIWNNIAEESILRVRILNYIALLKANYLSSKYVEYEFRICERSNNYVYLNIHILTVSDHIDVINYIKISASAVWGPNHEGKVALSQG